MYVMKHRLLTLGLSFSLLFAGVISFGQNKEDKAIEVKADSDSYWSTISESAIASGEETLFNALNKKIRGDVKVVGYSSLYENYKYTDYVPGKNLVWDMYGGFQYLPSKNTGNYKKPGDMYNREHSIPQSWFSEHSPMKSDIGHVLPTDGKINGVRSNFPFGEVDVVGTGDYNNYSFGSQTDGDGNIIQTAGYSKLGTPKKINDVSIKYSKNTVFEPDDQYKGDFARICLYFATCYPKEADDTTEAQSFYKTSGFPYLTDYGVALCLKWHHQDPVSAKETSRNDGMQTVQKNRNPYIDHPEWVDAIWNPNPGELTGIEVVSPKTTYYQGDLFAKPTVNALYDSGKKADVTSSASFSGFDSSTLGNKTIEVTYEEFKTSYVITVIEKPYITSVSLTTPPNKLEYTVGETINRTGMVVTASISDGTTANVASSCTLTPSKLTSVGEVTVNVTYQDFEAGSFTVTVNEEPAPTKELWYISKVSEPTKRIYNVGEQFDPSGLRIEAHYKDSDVVEDVTDLVTFDVTTFQYASESYPIIATYTENGITSTAVIKVKVNGAAPSKGCGGNIATTSIVLASISLAGIAILFISTTMRKKKNEK